MKSFFEITYFNNGNLDYSFVVADNPVNSIKRFREDFPDNEIVELSVAGTNEEERDEIEENTILGFSKYPMLFSITNKEDNVYLLMFYKDYSLEFLLLKKERKFETTDPNHKILIDNYAE